MNAAVRADYQNDCESSEWLQSGESADCRGTVPRAIRKGSS